MGLDKKNRDFLFEKNGTKYYKATKDNARYKNPQIVAFTRPLNVNNSKTAMKQR